MKKITIAQFSLADTEDPWLYAAQPIWNWEKSEQGEWVMTNALEKPEFTVFPCIDTYGYSVKITAKLSGQDITFFRLKWQ
jgi:hypothetical protein